MTPQAFNDLVMTGSGEEVLKALAAIPEKDRRKHAKAAMKIYKDYESAAWDHQLQGKPMPESVAKEFEAVSVAVLATCVPSEFVKYHWRVLPRGLKLANVFATLKPSWIDAWAEATVEDNPRMCEEVRELNRQGLCRIPETDAYILGYYVHHGDYGDLNSEIFLQKDVWRFFEVEGGGEFSLASHDKYTTEVHSWTHRLLKLCENGFLDRDRLLDVSLDALERDFGQFRAGWYSRFHTALAPSVDEMAARADRYLRLLASMVPPTVSFALKALKEIEKGSRLDTEALLTTIEPALQARQKSSANAALQLLKARAKQDPARAPEIARAAAAALISEAGEIQERALDLIEHLGQANDPDLKAILADYLPVATPAVLSRLTEMSGVAPDHVQETASYPVPELQQVTPVGSPDEAVSVFLELLEDCADPFLMERAIDGMARFGAMARDLLSPLAKRATQIRKRETAGSYSPGKFYQRPIAATALAWASGKTMDEELEPFFAPTYPGQIPYRPADESFEALFCARSGELLNFVSDGHAVPMLSAPTDNRGHLAPGALVDRLENYRSVGVDPGPVDLRLALMRLAPESRAEALARLHPVTEAERALAYALGADLTPDEDVQLWVIAWSSRQPLEADPAIQKLVGKEIAGAGTPARFEFDAKIHTSTDGKYSWPDPVVRVRPPIIPRAEARLSFGQSYEFEHAIWPDPQAVWLSSTNDWTAILRPSHSEQFFATGIFQLELDQKLSNHPCQTFLRPFFRPGLTPGPMAHAMLAWYLAAADEAIGTGAVDALATIIAQGRFDAAAFGDAAHKLVFRGGLPLRRWTKRLAEISALSPDHSVAVQQALDAMLIDLPEDLPRDLGGILELLYNLHVASGSGLANKEVHARLDEVKAGGKAGKFARQLAGLGCR